MKTLKECRISKGIKQVAVAEHLGVSRATYAKYENNPKDMSVGQAQAACEFIGCSMDDIFLPRKVN